jgi:hypothetical protein
MGDIPYIGGMVINELGKPTKLVPILVSRNDNNTMACAYLSVDQGSIADAVWTIIKLDTESFDMGSNFSSYRYVCPVTGYYQVNFAAHLKTSGAHIVMATSSVYANASVEKVRGSRYDGAATIMYGSTGGGLIYCNAGDYLNLYAYVDTDSGTSSAEALTTFMSVHLIST